MTIFTHHAEHSGPVPAGVGELFTLLDDHARLAAHMTKRSWKMGWGRMSLTTDAGHGREIGSRVVLAGRAFGVRIHLEEVVDERHVPVRKSWETVGEPRLLVIGAYRMGFEIHAVPPHASVRVWIDYDLPARGFSRALGRLLARGYADWCVKRMVQDAQRSFSTHSIRDSPAAAAMR